MYQFSDLNGSLDDVRLTLLITNATTDTNGGFSTGIDRRYYAITSVVGVENYYYIPYQFGNYWFISIRTFPNMDIVQNANVGNVRVYYMKR